MSSIPTFAEFLLTETGLPWEQITKLYNVGHPWPLWAAHDIRKTGLHAQAKGMLFPDVLSEIQNDTYAQTKSVLAKLEADDRACGSVTVDQRMKTITSLPGMKAVEEHIVQVAACTATSRRVVWSLALAIQRYVLLNPDWELMTSWPNTLQELTVIH